jgi:hypothetical protein
MDLLLLWARQMRKNRRKRSFAVSVIFRETIFLQSVHRVKLILLREIETSSLFKVFTVHSVGLVDALGT